MTIKTELPDKILVGKLRTFPRVICEDGGPIQSGKVRRYDR
jgi:hypothetical protein